MEIICKFILIVLLIQLKILIDTVKCSGVRDAHKDAMCLQILHVNDMLSKYDEDCERILNNKCYGGFARMKSWIQKKFSDKNDVKLKNHLLLNAGDTATGHLWYTLFRTNITAEFLNLIEFDAMSLGETDFNDGLISLRSFLTKLDRKTEILAANVDFEREPLIANLSRIAKSKVYDFDGVKVGIIGYLSPETGNNFYTGNIMFHDEKEALIKEARYLKFFRHCHFIIALGHSGFKKDKEIAKHVEHINVIVGGHSKTFLYSRDSFTSHLIYRDNFESSYPHVIRNKFGEQVLIVQAFAYTKYIGNLEVCLDKKTGKMLNYSGYPMILKAETAEKDPVVQNLIVDYKTKINQLELKVIKTDIQLSDQRIKICKRRECPIGCLVADSYFNYFEHFRGESGAVIHAGAFKHQFNFEYLDVLKLIGFLQKPSNLHLIEMSGDSIWKMFQISARNFHKNGFLQISKSLKVIYRRLSYTKLELKEIIIGDSPISLKQTYKIIVGSHIRRGREGYQILKNYEEIPIESVYDFEAIRWFLNNQNNRSFYDNADRITFMAQMNNK